MMTELALNVLDVTENSVRAEASLVHVTVEADTDKDRLVILIEDDGCGMTEEQVASVVDPFFTTRTTRKVGLGIPFYKYAAESTGGSFSITSEVGVGTKVRAEFVLSHVDRMPLGDMCGTMHTLITFNTHIDFVYTYCVDERSFVLDTREFKEILEGVPLDEPEVSSYIETFLIENTAEVNQDMIL